RGARLFSLRSAVADLRSRLDAALSLAARRRSLRHDLVRRPRARPAADARGARLAGARLLGAARHAGGWHVRALRLLVGARRLVAEERGRRDRLETAARQHPRCTSSDDKSVSLRTI